MAQSRQWFRETARRNAVVFKDAAGCRLKRRRRRHDRHTPVILREVFTTRRAVDPARHWDVHLRLFRIV
jgi:hypothetical protein